ncbi:uncharacterized protein LOC112177891 [Rosa chinensis]|uniref:uncharacterized protein LOC112177891 n=1 Tax=Rosa chinensis TaxID=74649 RepID=UPI000D08F5EF|nr:uncharacterized protein LOC112177891 [Rosa chinensis]
MNRFRKLLMQEEEDAITRNNQRALVMQAASSHILRIQEEESQWGGSQPGRQYIARDREAMDRRLKALYFASPCRFQGDVFRRRYRMRPHVFDQMMYDVANHDPYFVQTDDASCRVGLSTEQKLTCAMRMLAYGLPADLSDEFLNVAESTALEILSHFTRVIFNVYHNHYLRRPTPADLQWLLDVADKRGFPGMVGSLDCMHWQWKNCPTAWQGHFTGYKRKPTIILEAVASYDAWIWHAYFGLPGDREYYDQCYYLVDGIYPKWGSFMKAIRNPITPEQAHFTKMQESYRKDVERAFGILQAHFAIVRGPARGWDREDLQYIMMTCIILHNMIVDDEREEDEESPIDLDDIPTRPRKAQIYERYEDDHEVERNRPELEEFMTRYRGLDAQLCIESFKEIWLITSGT